MVFGSYDLQKGVEFCAEHDMYMIRPSATFSDADFEAVASNPYYVGEIGPGFVALYNAITGNVDALKTLAESFSYEDCMERRSDSGESLLLSCGNKSFAKPHYFIMEIIRSVACPSQLPMNLFLKSMTLCLSNRSSMWRMVSRRSSSVFTTGPGVSSK